MTRKLPIETVFACAELHVRKGEFAHARALYRFILAAVPDNSRATRALSELDAAERTPSAAGHDVAPEIIDQLLAAFSAGRFEEAIDRARRITEQHENLFVAWNVLGVASMRLERYDDAVLALETAARIDAGRPQVYNNLGSALQKQGNLQEASNALRKAIDIKPDYVTAHYNLAIVLNAEGALDDAIAACERALAIEPTHADVLSHMASMLWRQGRADDAIAAFERVLETRPDDVDACTNLGVVFHETGRPDEAMTAFRRALSIRPDFIRAQYNMAVTLYEQREWRESIMLLQSVTRSDPKHVEALRKLSVVLYQSGRLDDALISCRQALQLEPGCAKANNILGAILHAQGESESALAAFRRAQAADPDYLETYDNLSVLFRKMGRLEEAIAACEQALALDPDHAPSYNGLGNVFQEQGHSDRAIAAYRKALAINPDHAETYNNLGVIFQELGRIDDAIAAHKKAIELKSDSVGAYRSLFMMGHLIDDAETIDILNNIMNDDYRKINDRVQAAYALYHVNDKKANYGDAFSYLARANKMRKSELQYDIVKDRRTFVFLKKKLEKACAMKVTAGALEKRPIFIISMPRSGSTLLEQIISNHSNVYGAGELTYSGTISKRYWQSSADISMENVSEFRREYISLINQKNITEEYFTDKMPHNFLLAPLLAAAFPDGKIVHVYREAQAVCWSNLERYFIANGMGYCYDIDNMVEYYEMYKDIMYHWSEKMEENRIYHIKYENLTENTAQEVRSLFDYLGLDWEDALLSPEKNRRSVKTASNTQVRKPIYKNSSKGWQRYSAYLDEKYKSMTTFDPK